MKQKMPRDEGIFLPANIANLLEFILIKSRLPPYSGNRLYVRILLLTGKHVIVIVEAQMRDQVFAH